MRSLFGRKGGGSGRLFAGDGAGALCGAFSSGMRLTSYGRKYTGDNQGGSDRQTTHSRSNSPPFLLHERRCLLYHHDLRIEQLKPRLFLRCGEVALSKPLHLEHRIATRKEGPRCQARRNDRDIKPNLEDHCARDPDLRRSAETHEDASEAQDHPRLAIEALGVSVHRLAFSDDLREHDRQRWQLLILVHPDEGTRRLCQRGEPGSCPAARL